MTMAVAPEQAERLAAAVGDGKIHIVLRSIMDAQSADPPTITPPVVKKRGRTAVRSVAAVPQGKKEAEAVPQGKKELVVDVIRGEARAVETYALE
jgi:Flp pilus assembly protein CpaB